MNGQYKSGICVSKNNIYFAEEKVINYNENQTWICKCKTDQ